MTREQLLRILNNSFTSEWSRLTRRIDFKMNSMIEEGFLIDEMLESINVTIRKSADKILASRHQRYLLTSLARQYAMILFVASNEGREVNKKTVEESQIILKKLGKCSIHPCSKI